MSITEVCIPVKDPRRAKRPVCRQFSYGSTYLGRSVKKYLRIGPKKPID